MLSSCKMDRSQRHIRRELSLLALRSTEFQCVLRAAGSCTPAGHHQLFITSLHAEATACQQWYLFVLRALSTQRLQQQQYRHKQLRHYSTWLTAETRVNRESAVGSGLCIKAARKKLVAGSIQRPALVGTHYVLHRGGFGKLGQLWALLCHFICLCSLGKAKAQQPKFKRAEMQFAHSLSLLLLYARKLQKGCN